MCENEFGEREIALGHTASSEMRHAAHVDTNHKAVAIVGAVSAGSHACR